MSAARRTGLDRRRFLQGAGAVAATLAVFEFAGCASVGVAPAGGVGPGQGRHVSTCRRPRTPSPADRP